jgi:hypothetical protein
MSPDNLLTYCGVYCGTCARWHEYPYFREMARLLGRWIDLQGYGLWMPQEVKEFNYNEFRKALNFFGSDDTSLVCREGCKDGDAYPDCPIRKCCQERQMDVCFDCPDFPCSNVSENHRMLERAKKFKAMGRRKYLEQQVEKSQAGFEHHLGGCCDFKVSQPFSTD